MNTIKVEVQSCRVLAHVAVNNQGRVFTLRFGITSKMLRERQNNSIHKGDLQLRMLVISCFPKSISQQNSYIIIGEVEVYRKRS
ncbi:unnamed protein product [Amoebophrya sp. A120]|nr:unnamed protein product [Amoebophrya sp. A120]|eukprot:GSA120T00011096001.1